MSKVRKGQTVFDVALIETGDPLKGFENAIKAGLNPGDDLAGIDVPFAEPDANAILDVYEKENYETATMPTDLDGIFDRTFDRSFE